MYIQEYGDRTMWETILSALGPVVGTVLGNKLANKQGESSPEYKNAFNAANESVSKTQQLADQYTGNTGYQNSLEQAATGADKIANAAVGQATSGARSAGMSKAQAAAMGNQTANQAYANAFQNQQGVAQNMGQNAISAQQGITSAQQSQAGQAASEKQAQYNRKKDTMGTVANAFGNLQGTGLPQA